MENTEVTIKNIKNEKISIECSIPSAQDLQESLTKILQESKQGDSVLEILNFSLFSVLMDIKRQESANA